MIRQKIILPFIAVFCFSGTCFGTVPLTGVNLAGAEFAPHSLPGQYGTEYAYPTTAEIDYYAEKGMNIIRIPFLWERLQPTLNGSLDATELARLDSIVSYAVNAGITVILDPHNYARYQGQLIGSGSVPYAAFADLWTRFAAAYKNQPLIIFGLMNEPHTMPTEQWIAAANVALTAIRDAGATNLVLVPGNGWTGAHSWNSNSYGTPNAQAMTNIIDPGSNWAVEVHQYLDSDYSGRSELCVAPNTGSDALSFVTQWLRDREIKGFLGEFAGGRNTLCETAINSMLNYMQTNSDVWLGWSWWAGGPLWDDSYIFSLDPVNGVDQPQMKVLESFSQPHAPFAFQAFALTNRVILRWSDPLLSGFGSQQVAIRYAEDTYPTGLNEGSAFYEGSSQTTVHSNCTPGQTYYYTIWCTHDRTNYIVP